MILKERCAVCGTKLISPCYVCGAPVCCPKCCEETTKGIVEKSNDKNLTEEEIRSDYEHRY